MSLGEGGGWSVQIWPPDGTVARQMARRELARPSQEQSFAGPCVPLAQGPEEATALPANSSLGLTPCAGWAAPCGAHHPASLPGVRCRAPCPPGTFSSSGDSHAVSPSRVRGPCSPSPASPEIEWGLGLRDGEWAGVSPLWPAPAFPFSLPLSLSRLEVRESPGPGAWRGPGASAGRSSMTDPPFVPQTSCLWQALCVPT